jgi:protein TonB
MEEAQKKNRTIAVFSTIGFHALLLVIMLFAVGWRAPNPPWDGAAGIELNFGLDDQGSGDIQPETPVGTTPEQTTEQTQENPVQEKATPEVTEPQSTEEQITAKDESAVAIKDVKKDQPKEIEKTPEKPIEKPADKPKETSNPSAVYKPDAKSDGKTGQAGSHGDDVNKPGDKGNPQGTLRSDALYGTPGGGGGGSSLSLDGWFWDEKPTVKAPANESSGRVVFEIKVNAEGEIISIKTLERSLSLEMENVCKREIEKLTFSKTGINVPAVSTGRVTFVVLSK